MDLRKTLRAQGRSQRWLAGQIGKSHGYVRKLACGAEKPSDELRRRIADVLGVDSVSFLADCSPTKQAARSVNTESELVAV